MRPFALFALSLSIGCNDQSFHQLNDAADAEGPAIEVTPNLLDFGQLGRGDVITQTFTIQSVGATDLHVTDIRLGQDVGNFTLLMEASDFMLPPGTSTDVEVSFTPLSDDEQTDLAIVESDATDDPKVSVDLIGRGAVPELEISPDPYDFGEVYIGCERSVGLTLTNIGSDTLIIDQIEAAGTDMTYSYDIPLPATLEPGDSREVSVSFEPFSKMSFDGSLIVTSNEPIGVREATQSGEGLFVYEHEDLFEIPANPPSDIMFIVDQSCSMDDDQARLGTNFQYFISNLSAYTTNWQIIVGNNDGGCNNAGTILKSTTSDYQGKFSSAVQTGTDRYIEDPEQLLVTAAHGIENTDSGECNAGFMRDGALLHVVVVSDEPEQSGNWAAYTDSVIAKKGDMSLTRISAIAGPVPGGCPTAAEGTGYWEAVAYTGGVFLSICETDWTTYMEDLAYTSVTQQTFELESIPYEPTVQVYLNGVEMDPALWDYDAATNSIVFVDESTYPGGGDTVLVSYGELYSCD